MRKILLLSAILGFSIVAADSSTTKCLYDSEDGDKAKEQQLDDTGRRLRDNCHPNNCHRIPKDDCKEALDLFSQTVARLTKCTAKFARPIGK